MKEVIVNGVKWSPFLVSTTPKRARFSLSSTQWTGARNGQTGRTQSHSKSNWREAAKD